MSNVWLSKHWANTKGIYHMGPLQNQKLFLSSSKETTELVSFPALTHCTLLDSLHWKGMTTSSLTEFTTMSVHFKNVKNNFPTLRWHVTWEQHFNSHTIISIKNHQLYVPNHSDSVLKYKCIKFHIQGYNATNVLCYISKLFIWKHCCYVMLCYLFFFAQVSLKLSVIFVLK